MADLRPLIGAAALSAEPEADVLLTLTPDACMAARSFGLGYACVTLPRGATPQETDFGPVSGRPLLVWPDAGAAGMRMADALASMLPDAVIILPPQGVSDGWNLATATLEGWTADRVRTHIALERQRISDSFEALRRGQQPEEEPDGDNPFGGSDAPPIPEATTADPGLALDTLPFMFLGQDHGEFKYLSRTSQQITSLQAASHSKLNLLPLAPLEWWETQFPTKNGASWQSAANWMIQTSVKMPTFSASRARGRGCWVDEGRVLFHAGDRILVDGKEVSVSDFKSRFIYERNTPVAPERAEPLSNPEAAKLLALCDLFPWTMPIYARFLAGWCALAPICGALNWRPHIWITGPSGSGKSTCMTSVVAPLLGSFMLKFLGATTEAGIRQGVRLDAIPVWFDEAESENLRGQQRMQGVLELIRQASSESGGVIAKGTVTGEATLFNVRSCFCLSSVGVSATTRPDISRITSLTLEHRKTRAPYEKLVELAAATTMNPAWAAALRSRTMANIPTIRHNAIQFVKAATLRLGDARAGDQIGTLIAGAHSLTSTNMIDFEFAKAWVDKQDWSGFVPDHADTDENLAFARLLQAKLRVDAVSGTPWTTTYGDLVAKFYSVTSGPDDRSTATHVLRMNGVRIDETGIAVSNTHASIAEIFKDSPWAGKWKDQLSRVPGAASAGVIKFGNAANRAVLIPKNQLV